MRATSAIKPKIKKIYNKILMPYNCKTFTDTQTFMENNTDDPNADPVPVEYTQTLYTYSVYEDRSNNSIGNFEYWKNITLNCLNYDLKNYIYQYYDEGIQATITGYATKALNLSRTDIIAECQKVLDWIDICLDYYDSIKNILLNVTTEDERLMTSWDFKENCPLTEYIDWRNIKSMFNS